VLSLAAEGYKNKEIRKQLRVGTDFIQRTKNKIYVER
jgi:hypothetical protein